MILSLLSGAGIVWAMWRWMRVGRPWLAVVLLCTTWLFVRGCMGGFAMTGALAGVLALYFFFSGRRGPVPFCVFAAAVFGGMAGLAGPVAVMVWLRGWRVLRVREALVFTVLCVGWFALCYDGGAIFSLAPRQHLFWYFPRLLRDLLPWTPLYLWVIFGGLLRGRIASRKARFFLAVIWTNIVVFSFIGPKSEGYLLFIAPFAAWLTAALLGRRRS